MAAPFLALITPLAQEPGAPVYPSQGPGFPTNPIVVPPGGAYPTPPIAQPPLVIWGPGDPRPTLPIAGWDPGTGGFPTPPSGPPLGTWGGAGQPFPTNPIAEPPWGWGNAPPLPTLPPEVPSLPGKIDWQYAWTPSTGWIVVGIPQFPVPTPSDVAKPTRRSP